MSIGVEMVSMNVTHSHSKPFVLHTRKQHVKYGKFYGSSMCAFCHKHLLRAKANAFDQQAELSLLEFATHIHGCVRTGRVWKN